MPNLSYLQYSTVNEWSKSGYSWKRKNTIFNLGAILELVNKLKFIITPWRWGVEEHLKNHFFCISLISGKQCILPINMFIKVTMALNIYIIFIFYLAQFPKYQGISCSSPWLTWPVRILQGIDFSCVAIPRNETRPPLLG